MALYGGENCQNLQFVRKKLHFLGVNSIKLAFLWVANVCENIQIRPKRIIKALD